MNYLLTYLLTYKCIGKENNFQSFQEERNNYAPTIGLDIFLK